MGEEYLYENYIVMPSYAVQATYTQTFKVKGYEIEEKEKTEGELDETISDFKQFEQKEINTLNCLVLTFKIKTV